MRQRRFIQRVARQPYGLLVLFLVLSSLASITGCSDGLPGRVPVSGIVLIDGQPLETGSIMVIPTGERPAAGSLGPGGRFSLTTYELNDGVVAGTHQVTVQATERPNESTTRWLTPKKYGEAATSGLSVTIEEATDKLVIELTWDGKQPFEERM